MYVCLSIQPSIYIYIDLYMHIYIYVFTHTYIHIHIYIQTLKKSHLFVDTLKATIFLTYGLGKGMVGYMAEMEPKRVRRSENHRSSGCRYMDARSGLVQQVSWTCVASFCGYGFSLFLFFLNILLFCMLKLSLFL